MDIEKLMELSAQAGAGERVGGGQVNLKYLRDMLGNLDPAMPCEYDTGHHFGNAPVEYEKEPAYESEYYSHPEHDCSRSETAYPSCYRGYYADCTFNASKMFDTSTVAHVLALVNGAIGKTFDGYKGGLNDFTENTLVWGGGTSHSDTCGSDMVVGVEVVDGVCVIKTKPEVF